MMAYYVRGHWRSVRTAGQLITALELGFAVSMWNDGGEVETRTDEPDHRHHTRTAA